MEARKLELSIAALEAGVIAVAKYIGPKCVSNAVYAMNQVKQSGAMQDAARYEWLEKNATTGKHIDHDAAGFFIVSQDGEHQKDRYRTFGEAVDAAIAQEAKVGGGT